MRTTKTTTTIETERDPFPVDGTLTMPHWTPAGLVESHHLNVAESDRIEGRRQAAHGEPAPMALFAFACGTFALGMIGAGLYPTTAIIALVPALMLFAGAGQFIAGLLAFARGSTFGGTAFCSFGANNVVVATYYWMLTAGIIPNTPATSAMLGLELVFFGYIAVMLTIAAVRSNMIYSLVLALLAPGYVLSGCLALGAVPVVGHIGGWFLIAAAIVAFYAGGAVVVNSNWKREVLPLFAAR